MANVKDTVNLLYKNWLSIIAEFVEVSTKSKELESRKQALLSQLDGLLKTFDILGKRPDNLWIPTELKYKANNSLGDLIESILLEHGNLSKSEIIDLLQKAGRLDTKNSRVILANALKRDTKNRFTIKDGKVFLNEKR